MIKYKLKCENCENLFDSWFSSSLEFEKLKNSKLLNCHFCNSKNIDKTLMAPNILVLNQKKQKLIIKKIILEKKILKFQNFIKKNFEYVGNDFAYKARSLHYDNDKNYKGIFGNATKKQIRELQEEGIEANMFPWIEDKNN